MTVKDAKRFRKDYSDPTDVDGSGRRGTISKEYEIAPSKPKTEISQNEIATETTSNETPNVSVSDQLQASNEELNIALQQRADAEKNLLLVKQSAIEKQKIADLGGQEYTTNFQEAMRHANKTQAWSDTIDSAPLEKSNVFSKAEMDWGQYKAGDTLGVMTRNQRRAYDEAVAQAQLTEDEVGAMEDTGRSASETKAIQSKDGLETVIGGMDTSKASKSEGVSFKAGQDDDDENLLSKIFRPRKG